MKNIFCLFFIASLMACNNNAKEEPKEEGIENSLADSAVTEVFVPGSNPETDLYVWKSSPDFTKAFNNSIKPEYVNADSLIKGINEMNANVLLEKVKVSGDTIYTEIKDSEFLGNQMGSTGAEIYVADVVLNLTEVQGINYVNIKMKEGSHVQPGTWSKKNFEKYKPVQ